MNVHYVSEDAIETSSIKLKQKEPELDVNKTTKHNKHTISRTQSVATQAAFPHYCKAC